MWTGRWFRRLRSRYGEVELFFDKDDLFITVSQIFHSGFVHADPHPGNILVRKSKVDGKEAEIVILDHGLYEELPGTVHQIMEWFSFLWSTSVNFCFAHLEAFQDKLWLNRQCNDGMIS
jgi:hypothetical protein